MQAEPGRDRKREGSRARVRRGLSEVAEDASVEIDEAEQAGRDPAAKIRAMAAKEPWLPCSSAVSTGPPAWLRISHSKKTRMPVAKAFRKPWTALGRPRTEPRAGRGRPSPRRWLPARPRRPLAHSCPHRLVRAKDGLDKSNKAISRAFRGGVALPRGDLLHVVGEGAAPQRAPRRLAQGESAYRHGRAAPDGRDGLVRMNGQQGDRAHAPRHAHGRVDRAAAPDHGAVAHRRPWPRLGHGGRGGRPAGACGVHVVEERLYEVLGRPSTCPHGNPIPGHSEASPHEVTLASIGRAFGRALPGLRGR